MSVQPINNTNYSHSFDLNTALLDCIGNWGPDAEAISLINKGANVNQSLPVCESCGETDTLPLFWLVASSAMYSGETALLEVMLPHVDDVNIRVNDLTLKESLEISVIALRSLLSSNKLGQDAEFAEITLSNITNIIDLLSQY
ncbi:MAG: hypothetical protein SP1CHLAM54_13680 [Chlamydiia bacterium]|nr:hypothetical protein [Chlamydiia bacterium]MCH9616261.1 hypothetical protein [Chlamydiia bacterium]MCH9629753.1 hypothetical protein [Chlamydiia bacterium]